MPPLLLVCLLQNSQPMTTNVKHPYGTFYLHDVLHPLLLGISQNHSPRHIGILTLRWWSNKKSHMEALGDTAATRLILCPGSSCFCLIYSTLLGWEASIWPSRSTLLCSGRLTYANNPTLLHPTLEFGYCRALQRNPRERRVDGGSIYSPSSLSEGSHKNSGKPGQKGIAPFKTMALLGM